MDSLTLHCFIAVAETGSFTKAAQQVNRTQSAVTQQISKLEKMLGTQLFQRGKKAVLSMDGEIFFEYAEKLFSLQMEVLDRFKQPELEGEIRFGIPEDFAAVFLSDVLMDFSRLHPRILLNVECDLTLNLFSKFKEGGLDMVLVKMSAPEDFPSGVEVWSEPLEWAGLESHLNFLCNQPLLPLVLSPQPCVYRFRAVKSLEHVGIPWRIVYTSPSHAGIIASVKAGMGVTVLPRKLIKRPLQVIKGEKLPVLPDIHVSLLKSGHKNPEVLANLESFLLHRLKNIGCTFSTTC